MCVCVSERERERHALLTKAIELELAALENAPNIGLIVTCDNLCFSVVKIQITTLTSRGWMTNPNKGLIGRGY